MILTFFAPSAQASDDDRLAARAPEPKPLSKLVHLPEITDFSSEAAAILEELLTTHRGLTNEEIVLDWENAWTGPPQTQAEPQHGVPEAVSAIPPEDTGGDDRRVILAVKEGRLKLRVGLRLEPALPLERREAIEKAFNRAVRKASHKGGLETAVRVALLDVIGSLESPLLETPKLQDILSRWPATPGSPGGPGGNDAWVAPGTFSLGWVAALFVLILGGGSAATMLAVQLRGDIQISSQGIAPMPTLQVLKWDWRVWRTGRGGNAVKHALTAGGAHGYW